VKSATEIAISDTRFPDHHWSVGHRRQSIGQVLEGQPLQESTPGGIENRRIGDPKGVSSTHSNSANSETPIGERTVVLWTSRSHEKRVSRRELRGAESAIADRESGIREVSDSRPRKYRFPDGEIPDRARKHVGEYSSGFGDL
jgi:hypothetical protein